MNKGKVYLKSYNGDRAEWTFLGDCFNFQFYPSWASERPKIKESILENK